MTPQAGYTTALYEDDNTIAAAHGVWGYERSNGTTHGGADVSTTGDKTEHSPVEGYVEFAGKIEKSTGNLTWQWGWHVRIFINQKDAVKRKGTRRMVLAHNEKNLVSTGQLVSVGQAVGVMGCSGNAAPEYNTGQGPHCHVQVDEWNGSSWVNKDPTPYIGGTNTAGVVWYGNADPSPYPRVPSPVQAFGYGADISVHQLTFDPVKALANGIETVFIRATHGDVKDECFDAFAAACLATELNVGFYHLPTWHYAVVSPSGGIEEARANMRRQTEAFLGHIAPYTPTSYIALDYEIETGHSTRLTVADQTTLVNEQLALYEAKGYRCLLYVSISTPLDLYQIRCPLWTANYGNNNEDDFGNGYFWKNSPYYGRMKDNEYHTYVWQFSSVGDGERLAGTTGAKGKLDLNYTYMPMRVVHDLKPDEPAKEWDAMILKSFGSKNMQGFAAPDANSALMFDRMPPGYRLVTKRHIAGADANGWEWVAVTDERDGSTLYTPLLADRNQLLDDGPALMPQSGGVPAEGLTLVKTYISQAEAAGQQTMQAAQMAKKELEKMGGL